MSYKLQNLILIFSYCCVGKIILVGKVQKKKGEKTHKEKRKGYWLTCTADTCWKNMKFIENNNSNNKELKW